jgi:hypothetical protein
MGWTIDRTEEGFALREGQADWCNNDWKKPCKNHRNIAK